MSPEQVAQVHDDAATIARHVTMEQLWERGRRQFVIDCLARNEFPFFGWDKKYPDLAEARRAEIEQNNIARHNVALALATKGVETNEM